MRSELSDLISPMTYQISRLAMTQPIIVIQFVCLHDHVFCFISFPVQCSAYRKGPFYKTEALSPNLLISDTQPL
jgi:hypothetical protein